MSQNENAFPSAPAKLAHSKAEDALALITATALIALAVALFQRAHLLSGGASGLAFLLNYSLGWSYGLTFFCINLPFYWLAWKHMPKAFTIKTILAVALLSAFTEITPRCIQFADAQPPWFPVYAALIGGVLLGVGFLILFRHQASLGGVGIVAYWLQESRGWRAGQVQMAADGLVLLAALLTAPFWLVVISVVGAVVLNFTLTLNHRAERYIAH